MPELRGWAGGRWLLPAKTSIEVALDATDGAAQSTIVEIEVKVV